MTLYPFPDPSTPEGREAIKARDEASCDRMMTLMIEVDRKRIDAEKRVRELEAAIRMHYRSTPPDMTMSADRALWHIGGISVEECEP